MFDHDFAAALRWQGEPVELTAGPDDEFFAPPVPQESDDTGPHDVRAEDCWRCDARCSRTDVGLCLPCFIALRAEPIQWDAYDRPVPELTHYRPWGALSSDDDEAPWFEHTDVPPTLWPTVWLTIAVGFLADRMAAVVRWVRR